MSVEIAEGRVVLAGYCGVEDAEPLLQALIDLPGCSIDLAGAQRLHTAVVQLLLASRAPIVQSPADPLLEKLLMQVSGGAAK